MNPGGTADASAGADSEKLKAIVGRFYDEVWNRNNGAVADEVFAADAIRHDLRPNPVPPGPEGQRFMASAFRSAFPDFIMTVDFMVAEDQMVVARWTIEGTNSGPWAGQAASGARVRFTGVNIFRFEHEKVVEIWNYRDDLGLMQQMAGSSQAG